MSDTNNKKPSIFQKVLSLGDAFLDQQINKAKTSITMNENIDDELFYSKTLTEDPNYQSHSAGWKEKPYGRLTTGHLYQMSLRDSVIAAVIQTRQNHVANHSELVTSELDRGFMMMLRNEEEELEKIKEELKAQKEEPQVGEEPDKETAESPLGDAEPVREENEEISKAEGDEPEAKPADDKLVEDKANPEVDDNAGTDPNKDNKADDEVEEYNWELQRKAKEILDAKYKEAKKKAVNYVINCGETENRPFDTKKWNFNSALRAMTRDTLTYDLQPCEIVPNKIGKPHHWFPVDGGTIKYSTARLNDYKELAESFVNLDILYPEKEVQQINKQKVLELKQELLDKNAYKWVQVIRGKIERAYTEDELKVGIRNQNTNIYNNGYGISELELLINLVTGHLNAEFYNQAYFTQGFSAKGILHIKAAINRRKLEGVRQQWQHMLKGSRNSFQTPIFAGVDEVEWIPLTQNHNDIGFEGWMRYLTRMICAIYQIDPQEIGIGFKDEGSGGQLGGGTNAKDKVDESKDKGLYPLLKHFENFINEHILKPYDARFIIKFTGITAETKKDALERQEKEVKFKKTVNEIRAEDGLPPLPGMDNIILSPDFMNWYMTFSKEATEMADKAAQDQKEMMAQQGDADQANADDAHMKDQEAGALKADQDLNLAKETKPDIKKSKKIKQVKVDYYKIEE